MESAPGDPLCGGGAPPTDPPPSQRQRVRSQTPDSTADTNDDGAAGAVPPLVEAEGHSVATADADPDAAAEPQQLSSSAEPGQDADAADLTDGGAAAAAAAAAPPPTQLGAGQLASTEPAGGDNRPAALLPRHVQDIVAGLAQSQLPPELPTQKPSQTQPESPGAPAALKKVKEEVLPRSSAEPAVPPERAETVEVGSMLCETHVTAVRIAQLTAV